MERIGSFIEGDEDFLFVIFSVYRLSQHSADISLLLRNTKESLL
jgi:hypothetical protein